MTQGPAPHHGPPPPPRDGRVVRSQDLLAGAREVIIAHGRDEYRLRVTRQEKLILTK